MIVLLWRFSHLGYKEPLPDGGVLGLQNLPFQIRTGEKHILRDVRRHISHLKAITNIQLTNTCNGQFNEGLKLLKESATANPMRKIYNHNTQTASATLSSLPRPVVVALGSRLKEEILDSSNTNAAKIVQSSACNLVFDILLEATLNKTATKHNATPPYIDASITTALLSPTCAS